MRTQESDIYRQEDYDREIPDDDANRTNLGTRSPVSPGVQRNSNASPRTNQVDNSSQPDTHRVPVNSQDKASDIQSHPIQHSQPIRKSPIITRSGRVSRPPKHLYDFV